MSKIGIRAGHTSKTIGAIGFVREYDVVKAIKPHIINLLKTKHTIIDCQPNDNLGNSNLMEGIKIANNNEVDYFISIHANASGGNGVEVLINISQNRSNSEVLKKAQDICKQVEALGFKNRGVKFRSNLGELNYTNMPSMIVECFFVDNSIDTQLYKKVGAKAIGEAIALGFDKTVTKELANNSNNDNSSSSFNPNKVVLNNANLFISSTEKNKVRSISGTYYYWDSTVMNGRRKITNSASNIGKEKTVIGWIDVVNRSQKKFVVGQKVKISSNAKKYLTGEVIPMSIKNKTYSIKQVGSTKYSNGILLKEINSWVDKKDLN